MDTLTLSNDTRAETVARRLAGHAVNALIGEARLSPKPGLVDARGSGSHDDMDLPMLEASAKSLQTAFLSMALAGWSRRPDTALRRRIGAIGREGEKTMMKTTGGINTPRGAIWALGLLVTAGAMHDGIATADDMTRTAARLACLDDTACPPAFSKGRYVTGRYKVPGAREEAQSGFPHITQLALPRLAESRQQGASEEEARIDALLAIMTSLSDTCVLSRGGPAALDAMHAGAKAVLVAGGMGTVEGKKAFDALEYAMLSARVSPGGAADLLAASLFLDSVAVR